MLQGLHSINWAELGEPDTPKWIQGLISSNEKIRDESFDSLRDSHIDEGMKYASHIIPFIIEIVFSKDLDCDRALLLVFLRARLEDAIGYLNSKNQNRVFFANKVIEIIVNKTESFRLLSDDKEVMEEKDELLKIINKVK